MTARAEHYPTSYGKCPACGKDCFRSRKAARRAAKHRHPDERMCAYECPDHPHAGVWHYGHDRAWRPSGLLPIPAPSPTPAALAQIAAVAAAPRKAL